MSRGLGDPLLPHLLSHLDRATGVDIAVAFALESGVELTQARLAQRDMEAPATRL